MIDRRQFLLATGATFAARALRGQSHRIVPARPAPSRAQLDWQRDEMAMFLHFGVNTFTDREWGDGKEDPSIFAPTALDARQWARLAKATGFRAMILTAKHHDGFCLWPTRTTTHSVASSPFRNGSGDVVREFTDACRAEGLKAGLYLSPWDRNNPLYGDSPRYNDLYCDQLTELLTNYGTIAEVWFDGANGEGPNGKKQVYDWPRVWSLVRRLQPEAVMFSDAGPDVRWCGNENGSGGDPNWSTVDPSIVTFPGIDGPGITSALQHGDPNGSVWRPAEADTSIRKGWFYHPADDASVRSVENLYELYFGSVGRNAKLLLNVPPTRDGLIHQADARSLAGFSKKLQELGGKEVSTLARSRWHVTGERSAELEMIFDRPVRPNVLRLAENIELGQRVARYSLYVAEDTAWRRVSRGTTIGYAKLDRLNIGPFRRAKVVIDEAVDTPVQISVKVYDDR
jgi:alpha-L-fucosidase